MIEEHLLISFQSGTLFGKQHFEIIVTMILKINMFLMINFFKNMTYTFMTGKNIDQYSMYII